MRLVSSPTFVANFVDQRPTRQSLRQSLRQRAVRIDSRSSDTTAPQSMKAATSILLFAVLGLLVLGIVMLVWAPQVGIARKGAARWIGYGGVRLQPSEFAKAALIIAIAWYGERFQRHMGTFTRGILFPG